MTITHFGCSETLVVVLLNGFGHRCLGQSHFTGPSWRAIEATTTRVHTCTMKRPTFSRSTVLVLGANSIQSLLPSTLTSQVDSLLESHRLEDAYNLVDQKRKKLEESLHIDEDEVSSICV